MPYPLKAVVSTLIFIKIISLTIGSYAQEGAGLKHSAPFKLGVAVNNYYLSNPTYQKIVATEFNSITPESSFKFKAVHPAQGKYTFNQADELITFAKAHNLRVHGHNLIWGLFNPQWLTDYQGTPAQWRELMRDHIQTVIKHFGNNVESWDVVNEALYQNGTPPSSGPLADVWYVHLGINYIAEAFQDARAANPSVKLFYNETELEKNPVKLNALIRMVNKFKAGKVPVDGIGLEMHINVNTDTNGIRRALRAVAKTKLLVHISELDIALSKRAGFDTTDEEAVNLAAKQSSLFEFVVKVYKQEVPPAQRYGITIWGVNDNNSWLRKEENNKDAPLLFNDDFKKKPVYYKFLNALKSGR